MLVGIHNHYRASIHDLQLFLPANMICDIQPMDQAVSATFRIYYISRTVSGALWAMNKKYGPPVNKFWTGYIWMRSIILKTPGLI